MKSKTAKFSRPVDALPVPRLVRRQCQSPQWHHPQVDGRFGIWHSDIPLDLFSLICFYMFANSLWYCHLVCKVHNKPTATILFSRKWSNNKYRTRTSTMSECLWVFQYFSMEKNGGNFKSVSCFFNQLRWWVFVLPGPVSRQNSSMCQGDEIRNRWLIWMVGTFLVRKDLFFDGLVMKFFVFSYLKCWLDFFSNLRIFLFEPFVLGMSSSMAKR